MPLIYCPLPAVWRSRSQYALVGKMLGKAWPPGRQEEEEGKEKEESTWEETEKEETEEGQKGEEETEGEMKEEERERREEMVR